jgi:hypothetical protein
MWQEILVRWSFTLISIAACGGAGSKTATPATATSTAPAPSAPDVASDAGVTVMVGPPTGFADVSAAYAAKRAVEHDITAFENCFRASGANESTPESLVRVKLRVGSSGRVESAKADGTTGAESCIAQVITNVQFPTPPGGGATELDVPIALNMVGGFGMSGPPPKP